eukprot:GEMP01005707.1.p1 GENE.GEMP01005707.1~~GEMP01005707.1.p1  ORF type:complete len:1007 (+),score=223.31 GEMP01005707.1:52-3072(+)
MHPASRPARPKSGVLRPTPYNKNAPAPANKGYAGYAGRQQPTCNAVVRAPQPSSGGRAGPPQGRSNANGPRGGNIGLRGSGQRQVDERVAGPAGVKKKNKGSKGHWKENQRAKARQQNWKEELSTSEMSYFLQQENIIAARFKIKSSESTLQQRGGFVTTLEWRLMEDRRRTQTWMVTALGATKKCARAMAAKKMLEERGLAPSLSSQDRERINAVKQMCLRDQRINLQMINSTIQSVPPDAYEMFLVDAFRAAISQNCVQQLDLPRAMPWKTWSAMVDEATFVMEYDMLAILKNMEILGNFDSEVSRAYYHKFRYLIASERRAQLRQALEGRNEDEYQKLEFHDMRVTDRSSQFLSLQPMSGFMPDLADGDVIVLRAPTIKRPVLCKVTSKGSSNSKGPPRVTVKALRQENFNFSHVSVANLEGEVTAVRQIEALDAFAGPQDKFAGKSRFNFHPIMREALLHVETTEPGRIGLVHGPPGAGKTYTACEIVKSWLDNPERPKVLCVTDSNAAADNLHSALKSAGMRAVRFQREPTEECKTARSYNQWLDTKDIYLRMKTWRETLERYPVVVTTCSSAGHPSFDNLVFDSLILDEATQSTEPSSLVALGRSIQQCVLIGDPKQLPPTVFETPDLQVTLFDRVDKAQPEESKMFLMEQRRMHPEIMAFPSQQFYDGRLKASVDPPVPAGWPEGAKRVIFREIRSTEESRRSSKCNMAEVDAVKEEVERLHNADSTMSIAVITPYVAQKHQLSRALASFEAVVVHTIDGYQGNEADVVIFSTVRSQKLGFTDDPRRINVALTRAKRGLIVFGRRDVLNRSHIWREWVQWIDELNGKAMPDRHKGSGDDGWNNRPTKHRERCASTDAEVTATANYLFHSTTTHQEGTDNHTCTDDQEAIRYEKPTNEWNQVGGAASSCQNMHDRLVSNAHGASSSANDWNNEGTKANASSNGNGWDRPDASRDTWGKDSHVNRRENSGRYGGEESKGESDWRNCRETPTNNGWNAQKRW